MTTKPGHTNVTFLCPDDLLEELKQACDDSGRSLSDTIVSYARWNCETRQLQAKSRDLLKKLQARAAETWVVKGH